MNSILDASTWINFYRGCLHEVVLGLRSANYIFHIGPIVKLECGGLDGFFDGHVASGGLIALTDEELSVAEYTRLLNIYDLGEGETECIAFAGLRNLTVYTDDKAARRAAAQELGEERALGGLRLIRACVSEGLLTCKDAYIAYEMMKSKGAFLPELSPSYFCC